MRYRLIYSKNGEQLSCWSNYYSYILEHFLFFHSLGYDVEIWEYNETGSHLLERRLYNER